MNKPSYADCVIDPVTRHLERHANADGGNRVIVSGDVFSDDASVECRRFLFDLTDRDLMPNLNWLLVTKHPQNIAKMVSKPVCFGCGKSASCSGTYEGHAGIACDECCGHGCEDGYCEKIEGVRPNLWIGTVVSTQSEADERIPHLLKVPAKVRFVVCHPKAPINLVSLGSPTRDVLHGWVAATGEYPEGANTTRIDWVIAAGETGPNARPTHPDWFRSLRDQCVNAGVPFWFDGWGEWYPFEQMKYVTGGTHLVPWVNGAKSWLRDSNGSPEFAAVGKESAGRQLDGREWREVPQ